MVTCVITLTPELTSNYGKNLSFSDVISMVVPKESVSKGQGNR